MRRLLAISFGVLALIAFDVGSLNARRAGIFVTAGSGPYIGADGWTVFPYTVGTGTCGTGGTNTGTCVVYLSDKGTGTSATCVVAMTGSGVNDSFPDASACPMTPANISQLRDGTQDWLLLKRGACFIDLDIPTNFCTGLPNTTTSYGITTTAGRGANFERNGLSITKPMLIGTYGSTSLARPIIQSVYNCMNSQGSPIGFGNYIAWVGIDCNNAYKDPNGPYFPGIFIAGAPTALGGTTVTLSSPLPAYMGNGTGFYTTNLNDPNATVVNTQTQILSIDATRKILTVQALCGACSVATGDRISLATAVGGGVSNRSQSTVYLYVEDSRFRFSGIGVEGTTAPMYLTVRRSSIENSYLTMERGQGIYVGDTFSAASIVRIEENVVDHAGWVQYDGDCTPGQIMPTKCGGVASPSLENVYGAPANQAQGAYVHEDCCTAIFLKNILTNNSGAGAQLRPGGTFYNNFMARNSTDGTGGGILVPNNATYNVVTQMGAGYNSVIKTSAPTVSGNNLNFTHTPFLTAVVGDTIFNASNPSSLVSRTITAVGPTTITVSGAPFNASAGDTIYIGVYVGWGYLVAAASPVVNGGQPSNVQWNIAADTTPANNALGIFGGFGFSVQGSVIRKPGNVFANNYGMNLALFVEDQTTITNVDATGCSGAARITMGATLNFQATEQITISGVTGMSGVNGTWPITVPDGQHLCLVGSTPSGTYTSGTGLINGGVAFSSNWQSNVSSATPAQVNSTAFTPVGTGPGCPQALNCPTIEGYDLSLGGDGTLAHFLNMAKANRKGSWDANWTAAAANNYIRAKTSASIPLQ